MLSVEDDNDVAYVIVKNLASPTGGLAIYCINYFNAIYVRSYRKWDFNCPFRLRYEFCHSWHGQTVSLYKKTCQLSSLTYLFTYFQFLRQITFSTFVDTIVFVQFRFQADTDMVIKVI